MSELAAASMGAVALGPTRQTAVSGEARLPYGRQLGTVQPHPTPVVSPQPAAQPEPDENARRLAAAQARTELSGSGATGTGALVDITI